MASGDQQNALPLVTECKTGTGGMATASQPTAASDGGEEVAFSVRGCTVAGKRWGSGGARWLLFHGWMDNLNSWIPLIPHLRYCLPRSTVIAPLRCTAALDRDVEVVAVDLAGHGKYSLSHQPLRAHTASPCVGISSGHHGEKTGVTAPKIMLRMGSQSQRHWGGWTTRRASTSWVIR